MRFIFIVLCLTFFFQSGCTFRKNQTKAQNSSIAHYKLGLSFLNESSLQLAFVEFQKSVEKNGANSGAHYALGHIYYIWDMMAKSEAEFLLAVKINSDYSEVYNYLGKIKAKQGAPDEALAYFNRALENKQYQTPQLPLYHIGMIYFDAMDYTMAETSFNRMLKRFPKFILPYHRLAEIYTSQNRLSEAGLILKKAVVIAPSYPDTYMLLAKLHLKEGDVASADVELKRIINTFPNTLVAEEAKIMLEKK